MRRIGGPETQRHVVVDGNNLLQRAYYVFIDGRLKRGEPLMSGPKGYPIGVIYGSLSFLCSWLYQMQPFTSVNVFFDGAPARRRVLDPTYKKKREETKHDLRLGAADAVKIPLTLRDGYKAAGDIDILAHLLQLLGCDVYHDSQEEADDLIASYCNQHPDTVRMVVSDDKDFFQLLVDPRIVLFRPGSKDSHFFDADAAEAHWGKLLKGKHPRVPCSQVRMFKALCGDSSDDIVGVPLLRKKMAMTVCHYPTVEAVYASGMPAFSQSERNKSLEARERVQLNWELVGLKDDLDLSKCLFPAQKDYSLASGICREDLMMDGLDLGPFRPPEAVLTRSERLPDWLQDI